MRICALWIAASLALTCGTLTGKDPGAVTALTKPAFTFRNVGYFHRWSNGDQHEFTPENQENLDRWSDMMTVVAYPEVHDGERLAERANSVLENYKNHQARVLKTKSVPRTADRPAEHYIAVVFTRADFIEVAFARVKLMENTGCSFVYSHRIYGEKIGDQMSAWLSANGPEIEKALMDWSSMPTPGSLSRDQHRPKG
ncbi:MAG TPA: hypothetical protein VK581_10000 [Chthoniobacterales bacterium]|nr:hypothetical protein [Chthoniobacterales bacterium]